MPITNFPHGASSFGLPVVGAGGILTTGEVFFVHYTNGSNGNEGTDPTQPFKTLTYAYDKCTASQGDTIILMEGHAETITTAIDFDTAGVQIIGFGNGNNRPTITVDAAIKGLWIHAANISFYNIKLVTGSSSTIATKLFAVTGAVGLAKFVNCHFQVATGTKMYHLGYILGGKGVPVKFDGCVFENVSATTTTVFAASATVQHTCLLIRTGDVEITNCRFIDMGATKKGKWAECIKAGSIGTGGSLCSVMIKECVFTCRGVAVKGRAAAVSPRLSIIKSWGISTSSNTAVANIFQVTYANVIDSFAIGAVNVRAKMVPAATEA